MLTNAVGKKKEIVLQSNISVINTAYYQHKSYEALLGADNSFIERWGGEVLEKETHSLIRKLGMDEIIRQGKNLTGFEGNYRFQATLYHGKGRRDLIDHKGYVMSPLAEQYDRITLENLSMMMLK